MNNVLLNNFKTDIFTPVLKIPVQKTISVVVPLFNEAQNIPQLTSKLLAVFKPFSASYVYEIIFVNDGSTDSSSEVIGKIMGDNQGIASGNIKYLEFSRNFGKEMAITAGLNHCLGDCAIIMDADLQHPVEMIPKFLAEWEKGFEVVVGIRKKSKSDTIVKLLGSKLFYQIMSRISDTEIEPNSTDFRLLDRKVIDVFNKCTERTRITRGLIAWLGYKRSFIEFDAGDRLNGKAGYSTAKLVKLALSSFIAMSMFPLKVAGYLGILITLIAGVLGLSMFIEYFILGDPLSMHFSWPSMFAVANLFLVGIILSCLGLIALYIGSISQEVSGRPMYVVRERRE